MTASKIFLYFCLSFIGGIFLSSIMAIPQLLWLSFLILGILLISVFWKYKKLAIIGFCILFLILGIWRHQVAELRIIHNELRRFNDLNQEIALIGIISAEPDVRETHTKLTIDNIKLVDIKYQPTIKGKVLVTARKHPEYQYGDKLKITGKLKTPAEDINGFNYKDYLKKDGIYSIIRWPEIELLGQGFGNPVYKALFSFKNEFKETTQQFISPPQGGILEALFFGDEENISKEWKDKLNFTGTRHITAVSGMNITIIASLLFSLVLSFGLWRQQAFYLSIFLVLLYILMIGAPVSAVRAGIMGGFLLLAQYLGRMSTASRIVVFAATFMLALNPLLLKLDVGFQLSFLAILGIIYFQPIFSIYFKKIPNPKIFPLRMTLATTIAAQIFTLPILIYNFGYISLVSLITNILIVPFLAPITILIFVFGISGMIFWGFGWILSWPIWFALTYIVSIVGWFSQIPWAVLFLQNVHWVWLAITYLALGFTTWRLNKKFTRPIFLR